MDFGLPSTGGSAPSVRNRLQNQGLFSVPTGIQRLYEYGLYSTARFAAAGNVAGTVTRLFTIGQNGTGQGFSVQASVSETNMVIGAIAPGNETYEVSAISAEIFGATNVAPLIGDVRLFQRLGVFLWEFGSTTIMPVSPLSMIGAGGGIFGFSGDTGTPVTQANNGNGGLWQYQNVVVAIPATQSFAFQLQMGTAGQAASLAPTNDTQVRVTLFNMARSAVPIA